MGSAGGVAVELGVRTGDLTPLLRMTVRCLPRVRRELRVWHDQARRIGGELGQQASTSIKFKAFHCQGGAVFALMCPPHSLNIIPLIVAYQTISDYLDNLCDRAGIHEEDCFANLHMSLLDAITPGREPRPQRYYQGFPWSEDRGYLGDLVARVQGEVASLPSFDKVRRDIHQLTARYCSLQVKKHLAPGKRESAVRDWVRGDWYPRGELCWWEAAAAAGSTLGVFALMALASRSGVRASDVEPIKIAYFPWIGGLHILLDYLIDQEEDRCGGDLNFVTLYPSEETRDRRILWIARQAMARAERLPDPGFHQLVVRGLLGLYLSDPKVRRQGLVPISDSLSRQFGGSGLISFCRLLRAWGLVQSGSC